MKMIILGPTGKMGNAMVKCAHVNPDIELVGAVGPKGRDCIGKDIGLVNIDNLNFQTVESSTIRALKNQY